jgi:catechol 2,3-dioxygenase-like lactoylglutathione lyase family enzyme
VRRARLFVALLFLTACDGCPSHPTAHTDASRAVEGGPATTLLGGERGLDHVGIAVTDLDAATRTYRDVLGFNHPVEGTLPTGIHNMNYYFGDSTYLETMVAWDRAKAPWLASFTDSHEGALFAVLAAFSPETTTEFLGKRGVTVGKPYSGTIHTAGEGDAAPEEKWKTFFLPKKLLEGDPLYFISYGRKDRDDFLHKLEDPANRRKFHHRNTALGLRSVWIAVPDLVAAAQAYASIGLPWRATFEDAQLDAKGQRFEAGAGEVWLLASRSPDGPVAKLVKDRGGGSIMGVTIEAGSVEIAAKVIEEKAAVTLTPKPGLLGSSIRIPPELTHGVWIELAQR